MPTDRQLDETISGWLVADAPRQLSDRVLRETFDRTRGTRQQGRWRALLGSMHVTRIEPALAAVAAVVVAVLAVGIYANQPSTGGPLALPADGSLVEPGSYSVDVDGYRYTFRVPASGWQVHLAVPNPALGEHPQGFADVELKSGDSASNSTDLAALGIRGDVSGLSGPPCQELLGGSDAGPTFDDLVSKLADLTGFTSTAPVDATIAGYKGTNLQLTVQADSWCGAIGSFRDEDGNGPDYVAPAQIDEIWILQVEFGRWRVLDITYLPTTPQERVDELRQMVASLEIQPAVPPSPTPPPALPATEIFDSPLHGIWMKYPSGWQIRTATEPWTGGEVDFDSPSVDVIFDPVLRDDLYLAVVSTPTEGQSLDALYTELSNALPDICPESDGSDGGYDVGGAPAMIATMRCRSGGAGRDFVVIATPSRAYLVLLNLGDVGDDRLLETYGKGWIFSFLDTIELRPDEALDALGPSTSP